MAALAIDIGNTLVKLAVFEQDELIYSDSYHSPDEHVIGQILSGHKVSQVIISTVKKEKEPWEAALANEVYAVYFNAGMARSIKNHYLTPGTLGLDRLAGVIGAAHLYPQQNNLVIDGGTCIKYDYIDSGRNYYGGSISPGLNMRYKALNYYTGALPLLNEADNFNAPAGNDTDSAIRSGVQNGIKYETEGFIKSYITDNNELNIILTGGDSNFLDSQLKNSIFARYIKIEPYLVLKGLNAAIQYA